MPKIRCIQCARMALAALCMTVGLAEPSALQPPELSYAAASRYAAFTGFESALNSGFDPIDGRMPSKSIPVRYGSSARPQLRFPAYDLEDRAFILCWHTFLGNPSIPTDFSLDELARQVDVLLALGYRFVSLEDLLFGRIEGRLNIVATVPAAFSKVFAPRGILPALFIYPAVIGNTAYSMSPEQLKNLQDAGCLIGAHGYHHLYVKDELYRQDRIAFDREIYKARDSVEGLTGLPSYAYAYPFGAFSGITKDEVGRAGYAYGFAVKQGFVYKDGRFNDNYELPRSVVTREAWSEIRAFLDRNARAAVMTETVSRQ
jgi:hypothetical protein